MQRIGILELVQQQVFPARIQLGQQRGGLLRVGQQAQGQPFGIGEVQAVAFLLEGLVMRNQFDPGNQGQPVQAQGGLFFQRMFHLDQALGQQRMQFEETRRPPCTEPLVQGWAGFARQRLALRREEDGLQSSPALIRHSRESGNPVI